MAALLVFLLGPSAVDGQAQEPDDLLYDERGVGRRTLVHYANGVRIAWDVGDLLADHQRYSNNIRKPTPLNQKGEEVRGSGESPNEHFLDCFAAN